LEDENKLLKLKIEKNNNTIMEFFRNKTDTFVKMKELTQIRES